MFLSALGPYTSLVVALESCKSPVAAVELERQFQLLGGIVAWLGVERLFMEILAIEVTRLRTL